MSTKVRFNKSSFLVSLLLFFLCTRQLSAANVLGRPRKMYLIKTEHFDIVYSNQSEETALLLVQNADALYEKAAGELEAAGYQGFPLKLHMPVIISPDSDILSVSYTPSPYNRIIIFDAPADYETAVFEDRMLSLFYREIYKALAQSIRSPFHQFVAKWIAGESYQPVALFNLPYSMIEGLAYNAESESPQGRMNDGYFLQILSQAKLEGKFPKWSQISTVRDIYPGDQLIHAAGAGFSAFLMNVYGIEKYVELWNESGKFNPLLTQGVFYKVYEKSVFELWKEFEASVPLPDSLKDFEDSDFSGKQVFPDDKEANYEHILLTDYGTVWYDHIRHEVDIYDENNQLKMRQLLFLADNIERLSLSPDGRYIAVSCTQERTMEGLSSWTTWIYDLRDRRFLETKFPLRDAAIVLREDGSYAVAGVNAADSRAKLEVYTMPHDYEKIKPLLIYGKEFDRNTSPFSPVFAGNGAVTYILSEGTSRFLCRFNFENPQDEKKWLISTTSSPLQPQRLAYNPRRGAAPLYTFAFTLPQEHSFTRAGFIELTENFEPQSVRFTSADISGGYNFPVVSSDDTLLYSARKFLQNQLFSAALPSVPLEAGELREVGNAGDGEHEKSEALGAEPGELAPAPETTDPGAPDPSTSSLSDYKIRLYNPFLYMADLSITPFFPLKTMDLSEGNLYWPGLGLTVKSQTDPCMNTQALLSAGWTYLPLDFSWTKNMPSTYIAKLRTESLNLSKDKSAAFFIENSSTPVLIKAGVLFNCNLKGQYNFKVMAGGEWKLPLGIALRHLIFNIQGSYTVSTDYYDQTQSDIRPSLSDWPSFNDAYEMYMLSAKVQYTNIHQYGYSTFEQRGLLLGVRAYSMWDMYEVRLLREARKKKEIQQTSTDNQNPQETLTNAQRKNLLSESLADITQLNAGVFADIAIPRLTPLTSINGWVLSVPAKFSLEFMNKTGTALESKFQILLIGREIHNNLIPAVLYSRRAGLWIGYDLALVYDTTEVRLPDIRHRDYLAEVFSDISYTQALFAVINFDSNITLGKLSSVPINSTFTATWFPESNGYQITLDVRLHL